MRVAIAGAGAVGRSIARELIQHELEVMLIESDPEHIDQESVPQASWMRADACELKHLEAAGLENYSVVVAATGDDKANLVISLLAKTEFAVPRVVARVNDPRNEWLFNDSWGVDVAVSTPRMLAALVDEAVSVGDLVRLMTFRQGKANLVELTLSQQTPWTGKAVRQLTLPKDTALVAILRGERVIVPLAEDPLEGGDELVFIAVPEAESELREILESQETPRG